MFLKLLLLSVSLVLSSNVYCKTYEGQVNEISKAIKEKESKLYVDRDYEYWKERFTDFSKYNFIFVEMSAFPTGIDSNSFGLGLGYRHGISNRESIEYAFHVMQNPSEEFIICGKSSYLYYLTHKENKYSPYVGFGLIGGIKPSLEKVKTLAGLSNFSDTKIKEHELFMNGEISVGIESHMNGKTRQFLELTYFPKESILQLSLAIGL